MLLKGCNIILNIAFYSSPIGVLKLYSTDSALKKIEMVDKAEPDFMCSDFSTEVINQLKAYFDGRLQNFCVEYELPENFSTFRKTVYDNLIKVKYGTTISYKELAVLSNAPQATRAVGTAMAQNPIPIIIPCHRVIRTNSTIGNYSLGCSDVKKYLLDFEINNL